MTENLKGQKQSYPSFSIGLLDTDYHVSINKNDPGGWIKAAREAR
jgi:hypothetical protein